MTRDECETQVLLQIVAGSETTATAIRSTLLHIVTTPSVYHAIKEEITVATKTGKISSPITYEEAKNLPYLQVASLFSIGIKASLMARSR